MIDWRYVRHELAELFKLGLFCVTIGYLVAVVIGWVHF